MNMQSRSAPTPRRTPYRTLLVATALSLAIAGVLTVTLPDAIWSSASAHVQDGHDGGQGGHDGQDGHEDDHDEGSDEHDGRPDDRGNAGNQGAGERGADDSGSHAVESQVLREDVGPTEEEDSDRRGPKYGGGGDGPGKPDQSDTDRGDLYGDLYVILRDDNGVPILDANGNVQPIDAEGNLIPIDEEGGVLPEYADLVQAVEFGRLSVGRSPDKVSDHAYDEAIAALNAATAISVDEAGRIVVTIDGVEKTIDSPLENLALYVALMENGYLPGLELQDGVDLGTLSFLADPALSSADMLMAASLLAAASDKFGSINQDVVVYLDAILGVDGLTPVVGADGETYVDYSSFAYDRSDLYTGTVSYLSDNGDGTYSVVTESIMDAIFGGVDYTGSQADAFTQAAEDARAVILFIHEHPVPAP